jgi:hypothetical protein
MTGREIEDIRAQRLSDQGSHGRGFPRDPTERPYTEDLSPRGHRLQRARFRDAVRLASLVSLHEGAVSSHGQPIAGVKRI